MGIIKSMDEFNSNIKRVIISQEEIAEAVKKAGKYIDDLYDGNPILLVSILKGAFVFMADGCRAVTVPCEIGFMCAKSYYSGTSSSGVVQITMDLEQDIKDYHVVIIEDIVDSGRTLSQVVAILRQRSPLALRVLTLLDKPSRRKVDIDVEYCGFEIPDEFVVGYGLDYAEQYRALPYIGILKPEVYTK